MKLEVLLDPATKLYKWKLWDGPDGIDEFSGASNSLGHVFDDVQNFRTLNALQYQLEERDLLNSTSNSQYRPIKQSMTETSPDCCEAWPEIREEMEWFARPNEPEVLVAACLPITRWRINYCPSCGAERRLAIWNTRTHPIP